MINNNSVDNLELPDHMSFTDQEYILHHQHGKTFSLLIKECLPQPEDKQLSPQHLNFPNRQDRTIFSYKAIL